MAICSDDVATALPLLASLEETCPHDVEVRLYAAWARARLARSLSARDRDAIEQLARTALTERKSLALPLCILAHSAVRRGELNAARTLFKRAAHADPAFIDARRGLRAMEERLAQGGRGSRRGVPAGSRLLLAIVVLLVSVAASLAQEPVDRSSRSLDCAATYANTA